MATIFGNINNMTLAQFKKAIEYYENKINTLKEDVSLSDNAKAYFTNLYKNRVKSLTKTQQKLEAVIANARTAGIYVNEKTATFNSLGSPQSGPNDFESMAQNQKKYKRAQFFRILGIVLLPLVGTIPFIRAYKRAKQKYKDIQNAMSKENTDLKTFVHNEHRPYDNKLTTSESLSNEEIEQILTLPGEVARLENILTSSSLSPVEKKNLTAKLIEIKTYAQENGFTLDPTVLTSSKFDTEKDKAVKNINTIKTDVATETTFTPSSLNIKQLHEKYEKLTVIAEKITAALDESPDNADLLTAQTTINTSIENVKTEVQNQVTSESNKIISDLNGKKAKGSTKTDFDNSNTALDAIYNNVSTNFGTSLEETKTIASELGGDVSAIEKITETYNSLKEENNKKIEEMETHDKNKTKIEDNLKTLKKFVTDFNDFLTGSPGNEKCLEAYLNLNSIDEAINTLLSLKEHMTFEQKKEFDDKNRTYQRMKKIIESKYKKLDFDGSDYETAEKYINELNTSGLTTETELKEALYKLTTYSKLLTSTEAQNFYTSAGMSEEYTRITSVLNEKLNFVNAALFEMGNTWKNINNDISSCVPNTDDSLAILNEKKEKINKVIETLESDKMKNTESANYATSYSNARNTLINIQKQIEVKTKEAEYLNEVAKIEVAFNQKLGELESLKGKNLKSDRDKIVNSLYDLVFQLDSISSKASKYPEVQTTITNLKKNLEKRLDNAKTYGA